MAPIPNSTSLVPVSQLAKPHSKSTSIEDRKLNATHISELVTYFHAIPQSINIPHDFVREGTGNKAYGHTSPFEISDSLVLRLVKRTGGSSSSCLVSVFAATLHLFAARQEDFAIAVSLDDHHLLALRTRFQHAVDMEILHAAICGDLQFLAQRQVIPLHDIVETLGIPFQSLLQASFTYQETAANNELFPMHSELACLVKLNLNGSFTGSFIYDSNILAHDTVVSFSSAFTRILSVWAGEATPNLDAIVFINAPAHFPSQSRLDVSDISFGEFLLASANENKERHAVYDGTSCTSYTYQQLFTRAQCIQNLVRSYHRPNGMVLLLLDRTVDFIAAEIGVNLAGMAFIPCDVGQPAARIRDIVSDASPACIIAHQDVLERLGIDEEMGIPLLLADTAFNYLETNSVVKISPDEPGETAYMIYTSGSTGKPKGVAISHASVIAFVRHVISWVQFKTPLNGVVTANIAWDPSIHHTYPPLATGGCVKIPKIDGEKDGEYLRALMRISPEVNMYGTTTAALRMWLSQTASHPESFFPPRMLHVCLGGDEVPLQFIEQVFTELAGCPNAEIRHIYGPTEGTIFGSYGVLTRSSLAQLKRRRRVPLEKFMPHVAMTVANAAGNELPRGFVGEIIIWGPSLLLEYHNLPEVNAQRFLAKDGIRGWRSGDLGRHLPSGQLEILGRIDSMRKVKGGFRVELQEIEAHVQSFAEVDKCHISTMRIGDSDAELEIVAHVVLKVGCQDLDKVKERKEILIESQNIRLDEVMKHKKADLSLDYGGWNPATESRNKTLRQTLRLLHQHLLQRVPTYMVPSYIIPVCSLPLTSSHKIDNAKLQRPCPSDRITSMKDEIGQWDKEDEARRPIVEAILKIFSEALFANRLLSPKDNFFFSGGHSLVAAQVISVIRRELKVELPFTAIIANPTASQLAAQIEMLQKNVGEVTRVPNIIPLNWSPNSKPKALVFVFPLAGGDLDRMPEFMNKLDDDGSLGIVLYGLVWEPNQHLNTLEKITQSYANSIASIAGSTPTFLVGWCYGGCIAACVAQCLPKGTTKVILLNSPSIAVMADMKSMPQETQEEFGYAVSLIDCVWDMAASKHNLDEAAQRRYNPSSINGRNKVSKELAEANIDRHDSAQLIEFMRARIDLPEWVTNVQLSRYLLPLADSYDVIHDVQENHSFSPSKIAAMEEQVVLNMVCKQPYTGFPLGNGWSRFELVGSDEWYYAYQPEVLDRLRAFLHKYILGN